MGNPILTKNYLAEAAVPKCRLVKPGSNDGQVVLGAAATDSLMGVSEQIDAAINERVDVIHAGIAEVEFGGAVTRGGEVTSDGTGKAVACAPAAGANARYIGFAIQTQATGDIGPILVAPGIKQG